MTDDRKLALLIWLLTGLLFTSVLGMAWAIWQIFR